jgi:hypothetical protein
VPRCAATKSDNTPCERIVDASQDYCYSHDPSRALDRQRASSKAGRSKGPMSEIAEIKRRLLELVEEVIEGQVDKSKASVAIQGLGVMRGYFDLERKIRELEEIEARLEALEVTLDRQGRGASRYGA